MDRVGWKCESQVPARKKPSRVFHWAELFCKVHYLLSVAKDIVSCNLGLESITGGIFCIWSRQSTELWVTFFQVFSQWCHCAPTMLARACSGSGGHEWSTCSSVTQVGLQSLPLQVIVRKQLEMKASTPVIPPGICTPELPCHPLQSRSAPNVGDI